jgi:carbon monoxide dehydrogenase subunit G
MRMVFGGAPVIDATKDQVWRCLLDPQFVGSTATAIESVTETDATHFAVVAGLGIGSLKLRFKLAVELFDIVTGASMKMRARGKAPGSTLDVVTTFQLEELEPKKVKLVWEAVSDVGGTVASVGARLLEGTSRRLAEEFWQDFAVKVSTQAMSSR